MEAVVFDPVKKKVNYVKRNLPPQPTGNEVLVKVAFAGICGTDLHIAQTKAGNHSYYGVKKFHGYVRTRPERSLLALCYVYIVETAIGSQNITGEFPCGSTEFVLGHEFSGWAEAVGPEVIHIKPGQKVVVDPNSGCHSCRLCTSGKYHLCKTKAINDTIGIFKDGGWAEYCLVPGYQVFRIPDGITLSQAVLTEPLSCIAHGWNRISPVRLGQTILIQGAGIIGNLWAAVLHLQGHVKVIVSEPNECRKKISGNLGTSYKCVHPSELQGFQADIVIDCSGSPKAVEFALDLLSPGGKLCIFGVAPPEGEMRVSPYEIYKRELTIVGVMVNPFAFPEAFGMMEAMGCRYLDYNRLGIQVFALKDFAVALESLKSGKIAKAVFKVSE